ncbi:hypothetical protein B0J13DRAFT_677452 [Dactylonectria estremocensis]|uniref:Linalool dehydratase/isomerase domain-containing protein n=1 Tax=Dactylonectria estremocensis TaxID=1079267 RepID=A0A9P9IVU2_9HYPO|nr:hypothetical protein B0J13DRAFT_677452 [Dactylonectria estremocensis]
MTDNPYCLCPCEPNYMYSLCNLTGMAGLVMSDRILGRDFGSKICNRFERSLGGEFTDCDGRILLIHSKFPDLTLPGLCGTLIDCINAMLLTAYLPRLAHGNWAIIRNEFLKYDDNGQLEVKELKGTSKIDPNNYRAGESPLRAFIPATAAYATWPTRLFTVSDGALQSPLLEDAKFPDVLVAKAYSIGGEQLDLVLYNGKEPGVFRLGFDRLTPNKEYKLSTGQSAVASEAGKAYVEVNISGRTQIVLQPVN